MSRRRSSRLSWAVLLLVAGGAASAEQGAAPRYPSTRRTDQVDTLHGVAVADPYRWLETDVRQSPEVRRWVEEQNRATFAYLAGLPERPAIARRLTALWNYERFASPQKAGRRYVYSRNDGLQNQSVLYVQESLAEEPRVLLDPNTWSADGTMALSGTSFSDDGELLAYATSEAGSDWQVWRVLEVASGKVLADELRWCRFTTVAWTKDGRGFFYARYPAPAAGAEHQALNFNQRLFYHRLGTAQADDVLVYARPDQPEWGFFPQVTEDGRYLLITVWKGTANRYRLLYRDLEERYAAPVELIAEFAHDYALVGSDGPRLLFRTDRDAPRGRVVEIDLERPRPEDWREVIAQGRDTLVEATFVGNLLFARYLEDAKTRVQVFTRGGQPVRSVDLPGIGNAEGFGGRSADSETFYVYASFATPPALYRYDTATGQTTLWRQAQLNFDPAAYEVEQVFYDSKDGTRVPMFLAHKRGLVLDGGNPTLLFGYGGFAVSETPRYSASRLAWMEMGGVFALANLRGGGEYGEEWHQAGTKLRKQNVFDDFIAAAEWLIAHRYTRPERLAIHGGSNGGLLIGAVLNQRPELFGAAWPAVGVMDMLRFHRFTAGRFWVDDYGSADDPAEFQALYAYSPYHNVRAGTRYPATLVTTADTDDRVVPGHSFKYIAALQHAQAGPAPVLARIETRAGHGAGKPLAKVLEETADAYAFLVHNLGFGLPEGYAAP